MNNSESVELLIDFRDSHIAVEQQERLTQSLYRQGRDIEGVKIERVVDDHPPEGVRGASFLWGLLRAEVSLSNIKNLLGFLGNRLADKAIKITAKFPDGREFEVEVSSQEELREAEKSIQRLSQIK